jgi:6-phosphogluconolactonase (cycloisomerase 2 family)
VAAGDSPRSVAVDPSGRFAYVANYGSANVSAYAINATSGALTALAGSQFTVGANPSSVSVDPSGKFLYVTSSGSNDTTVFTLDAPTGLPIAARTVAGRSGSLEMAMTKGTTAVRYTPKFAYVGNPAGAITAYTISATDGALTVGASAAIGGSVSSIAVDPSARFAYVANQSANNISIFNIDSASGNLTTTVGPEPTGGTSPQSVIVDPSGRFAYVVNADSSGTVSAYTIGATNGALTRIDADPTSPGIQNFAAGAYPRSAAVDPAGRFLYAANSSSNTVSVYAIDASTGTLTAAGPAVTTGASSAPSSITVDPTGRFAYVANGLSNTVSVFRIDPASGALTAMGSPVASGGNGAGFITVDPSGRFVYVTHPITWSDGAGNVIAAASNDVSVFTIDPASGALMAVGSPVATGAGPYSMAVELSGRFTYVASNGSSNVSMYRINDTSGELTAFGVPLSSQYAVSVATTGTIE